MHMPSTGTKQDKRDAKTGRFIAGNRSGGRKKLSDDVKHMLMAASAEAVQLLIDTMRDEGARRELRVSCAETIIDRVYGKAAQPIDAELDAVISISLSDELSEYAK